MMTAPEWLALVEGLVGEFGGRRVLRVVPSGRTGLHLVFAGAARGLRFESWPGRGFVFPTATAPERLRGGRGVWPDMVAAADRVLAGQVLIRGGLGRRPLTVVLEFSAGRTLALVGLNQGGAIVLEGEGEPARTIPSRAPVVRTTDLTFVTPSDQPVSPRAGWLITPGGAGSEPRANWVSDVHVVLESPTPEGGVRPAEFDDLGDAVATGFDIVAAAWRLAARRDEIITSARSELRRARRALDAVQKDSECADAPDTLRRTADALLSAGPAAMLTPTGAWAVPDPTDPGRTIEAPAEPPGASIHATAARLYARARKLERGQSLRRARADELSARIAALDALFQRAQAADDRTALDALEREAAPLLPAAVGAGRGEPRTPRLLREGRQSGGPRVFRSPGGFEVLVGRSARENDRLTFAIADANDHWLHAQGWSGAHVVVRLAGSARPGQEDILFAARLAAAYSKAPRGEAVDVLVCRRKNVHRARGAGPGTVTVRKCSVVRVRAGDSGAPRDADRP